MVWCHATQKTGSSNWLSVVCRKIALLSILVSRFSLFNDCETLNILYWNSRETTIELTEIINIENKNFQTDTEQI